LFKEKKSVPFTVHIIGIMVSLRNWVLNPISSVRKEETIVFLEILTLVTYSWYLHDSHSHGMTVNHGLFLIYVFWLSPVSFYSVKLECNEIARGLFFSLVKSTSIYSADFIH
jgi:hypothetical protein